MNLDSVPFQLDKEQIKKLMEEGKIRFRSYGEVPDFFAVLDDKHLYRKSDVGMYYLLPKNFKG